MVHCIHGGVNMFFEQVIEDKYNEVYDSIYNNLKVQYASDIEAGIIHLERQIEDLYIFEGNDWLGRNDYKAASISATIAACETLLIEFKEVLQKKIS